MRRFVAPLIAALCLPAAAMAAAPVANEGLARIEMQVETGFLSAEERQVVNLLIQAADEMTAIYKRQAAGEGPGHGFYPPGMTKAERTPAFSVEATNTTGAGDVFHGAYALAVAEKMEVRQAMRFAAAAGALRARDGATPDRAMVDALLA